MLRARPLEEKIGVTKAFASEVVPLFAQGALRTAIDNEFPLTTEGLRTAHQRVGSNESLGKVVLRVD